jgi:acetyltransferase-like isoleucine patch superfamily enzyme
MNPIKSLYRDLIRRINPYTINNVPKKYKKNIGKYSYGNPIIHDFNTNTTIYIGKFCSFAQDVHIYLGGNHRTDWVSTYPFSEFNRIWPEAKLIKGHPSSNGDVIIGNDVWIGDNAIILSGVSLGDGATIGAYSVVTNNVDPYAIVAGNPARLIRKRFDDSTISILLKIKWWDWPIKKIKQNISYICNNDIEKFLTINEDE